MRRVPPGRVISYGAAAAMLGAPRSARAVARALRDVEPGSGVPWWRVVNSRGTISLTGAHGMMQRSLLEAEGVRFGRGGVIDWSKYGWRG